MQKTPGYYSYTDSYFKIDRRIEYLTFGSMPESILKHVSEDFNEFERNRILRAAGFDPHVDRNFVGDFSVPLVICGRLYPIGTLAAFEGREQGCRLALFTAYRTPTFIDGEEQPIPPETGRRTPTLM